MDHLAKETLLQHLGEEEHFQGAVAPPIFQASNFQFDYVNDWRQTDLKPEGPPYVYSRVANPSVTLAERKIAALEGTEACTLFGSGQGAITAVVMANTAAGAHVVTIDSCYGPLRQLLEEYLPRFGVSHTLVSGLDADEWCERLKKRKDKEVARASATRKLRLPGKLESLLARGRRALRESLRAIVRKDSALEPRYSSAPRPVSSM